MISQKSSVIMLITCTIVAVSAFSAYAILENKKRILNSGSVEAVGVEVYWEINCLNSVSSIDWGSLELGTAHEVTIYIKNEGTVPVTLNMSLGNWTPPAASTYVIVEWNREGQTLNPEEVLETTITLSISPETDGISNFTFYITIAGNE